MTGILHEIPWQVPACLASGAILLHAMRLVLRSLIAHARAAGRPGRRGFRTAIITFGAALAPVFFADMFKTVVDLLSPSFHGWAWTVPAATEGSFIFLYLLDLYLLSEGKPKGWLRFAPYPFALASLILNVYASFGDLPGMLGHGVVTIAFFLPILAGESAVKSLSVSDDAVRLAAEMKAARRYAIDLVRDQLGFFWRFRPSVPSLLRTRIISGRLPGTVARAVRDGAAADDATLWEPAVEKMVTTALTQRERLTEKVRQERTRIDRQQDRADDRQDRPADDRQQDRQDDRQKPPPPDRQTAAAAAAQRAKVRQLLTDDPAITLKAAMEKSGASESTVTRVKREMRDAGEFPKPALTAVP